MGQGIVFESFISKEVNPLISKDLNDFEVYAFQPSVFDLVTPETLAGGYSAYRMSKNNTWQINGVVFSNFFEDYYFRIHTDPVLLDLQTVASSQKRQISVWNAHPFTSANVSEIEIENSEGILITGDEPPFTMTPLLELTYDVEFEAVGPPTIDSSIQFVFLNVDNPKAVLIVGTRAIKFDIAPEVPVVEDWTWSTTNLVAVDGTEQRIALRGEVPRTTSKIKVLFDNAKELREFYATFISAKGRVWLPEFQYATRITAKSIIAESIVYFDASRTDIRPEEYVLIQTLTESVLIQVVDVLEDSATLVTPLTFDVPEGSFIIPGSAAILDEAQTLKRMAIDDVAELNLSSTFTRDRSQIERIKGAVELTEFKNTPVLDKRPLANTTVDDTVSTGQISIDNGTGILDSVSRWDYSRIGGKRSYSVKRTVNPAEMDYWKAFFAFTKGQAKKFFIPTYRNDLQIIGVPGDNASSYSVEGSEYTENIFPIPTHRYLEIETSSGIHRTEILGSSVVEGNSVLAFETNVPTGEGWTEVKRISYLLPCRLNDDVAKWSHYSFESLVEFSIRTAEI